MALRSSARAVTRLAAGSQRGIWGLAAPQVADGELLTPLDIDSPVPLFDGPTPTKVTTLENGLRVASSDLSLPCTTVGVYVATGSKYESVPGTCHVLQHMAFKSSMETSQFKMTRELEAMGAVPMATAARENMVYQVDCLKESVPAAVELLAQTMLAPKLLPWEVDEQAGVIKTEIADLEENPMALVQELIHPAAYGGNTPLGQPLMAKPSHLGGVTTEVLSSFISEQYTPSKMVLTAAGYDHDELVKLAKSAFGSQPAGAAPAIAASPYVGGETRITAETDLTHFALAFEGVGWRSDDLVPVCVLNTLLGGGASFSAGGPGKGMYTRLYQNILNQHHWVQAASVFNSFYNESGLIGVYGAAPAEGMGSLVPAICEEFKKLGAGIGEEELSRAKEQLKSSLLMNLESRPVLFEDIGRQVLTYGARTSPEVLIGQIDAVTTTSLAALAAKLTKSAPSVVVYGDTTSVPRYDLIAKQFA